VSSVLVEALWLIGLVAFWVLCFWLARRIWLYWDRREAAELAEMAELDAKVVELEAKMRHRRAELADLITDECLAAWAENRPNDICPPCADVIARLNRTQR
jgi:type VI protein secretion system component VasK